MPGDFEQLEVYQVAREFRKRVYRLAGLLPAHEQSCLARQMRRAAVSLTSNIAEGEGRWQYQDAIRFERLARGSLNELLDQINVCADERYAEAAPLADLREHGYRVRQLLDGYIRYLVRCKRSETDSAASPPTKLCNVTSRAGKTPRRVSSPRGNRSERERSNGV